MKKFLLLLVLFVSVSGFCQDFAKNWEKVYADELAGKIKSASDEVDKIYAKAKRNGNQPQIIKTFLYRSKFSQTFNEEVQARIIENLKKELKTTDIVSRSIFYHLYAKLLSDYKDYNFYDRETLEDTLSTDDFREWSNSRSNTEIKIALLKSIENEGILLKTPLNQFEEIIEFNENDHDKNRSLYDFLIDKYFEILDDEVITKTEDKDYIKKNLNALYGDSKTFVKLDFTNYSENNYFKLLQSYQKIENSYISQNNKLALSYTVLKRLKTVYTIDRDFVKYLVALENGFNSSDENYKNAFKLEIATIYQQNASKTNNENFNKKAIEVCDQILLSNQTEYTSEAKKLKNRILQKTIRVNLENAIFPNAKNRALVTYKNVDTIYGSIYKISNKLASLKIRQNDYSLKIINTDSLFLDYTKKNLPYKTFAQNLPSKNDYLEYSTEIIYPELETGNYLLFLNTQSGNINSKAIYSTAIIKATELKIATSVFDGKEEIQVFNRKTGKPIENAVVKYPDGEFQKTDSNGKSINLVEENKYQPIEVSYQNDTITNTYYVYKNQIISEDKRAVRHKVNLFTDRSIYRPGQTVYFKGIASEDYNKNIRVIPDYDIDIIIKNSNHEDIFKTTLKTNEFGSVTGNFVLPKNGLTGNFKIIAVKSVVIKNDEAQNEKNNNDQQKTVFLNSESNFNVEEYKRPKFQIQFEPTKENYLVNQKIKVKGKAEALGGNSIANAKVTYLIKRTSHNKSKFFESEYSPITIDNGEVTTDQMGNFEIEFTALASELSENLMPIFNYAINVTVTDSNGETISAQSEIKVGYHNLELTAQIPINFNAKLVQEINVNTTNLNHQFIPANAEIKIYKLKSPDRVLKNRLWEAPEIQTIAQKDFEELFPNEPYADNTNFIDWQKGKLVFDKSINTQNLKNVRLENTKNWESGKYLLIVTAKDISGKQIETSSFFSIYQDNDKKLADNQIFSSEIKNKDPKKDGFAEMQYSSATEKLYVATEAFIKGKVIYSKIIEVNRKLNFKIPIDKKLTGRLDIKSTFVWQGEGFNTNKNIELIEEKEKLDFEIVQLKNKIEPGSENTWIFKLKNSKRNISETEALATMYDASLDAFLDSSWDSDLDFGYNFYNHLSNKSFPEQRIQHLYFKDNAHNYYDYREFGTNSTDINWFGFNFMYPNSYSYEYNRFLVKKFLNSKNNLVVGNIKREGTPQDGITVSVLKTSKKTKTNAEGTFEIKAKIGDTLAITFKDNLKKTIAVKQKVMNLNLNEFGEIENYFYDEEYGEIVMDGTQSEVKLGVYTITEPLQGVAGVSLSSKGSPGANTPMKIRGPQSSYSLSFTDTLSSGVEMLRGFPDFQEDVILNLSKIKTRKNFNETAFFYPQLKTDKDGKISFNFTSPEALTQWKLRLFAHDKKANSGYLEHKIITQKDFMITPNLPRFLREKDSITITTKISNLTPEAKSGMAMLQLFDAVSMETIDAKMLNLENTKPFKITAKGNTTVSWKIYVPEGLQSVQYKIVAKAGNFSDGEENILPVLTNNMLVTESIPVWVRENSSKEYTFENLKNNTSTTLRNQQLTFEYTSNPTWLAIQALPYLMEYEHECAEQTFARYYANALASEILNSNPKIAEVFESWKKSEKPISKLEQNEELKSILLAETPWIADALSEEEKKKNLATIFDLQKMKDSQKAILEKLTKKQKASGGFSWFEDGEESEYITRHIISGLGHLQKLSKSATGDFDQITKNGVSYLDQKFLENHKKADLNNYSQKLIWTNPYNNLHFLYARSFYLEKYPLTEIASSITQKYTANIKENWLNYSLYEKGLASLVLSRFGEKETAKKILESLRQTSSNNEDWGMYWIDNKSGWYWYQAPIETQALLIEAFAEIENDKKSVDAMKVWLLKNKQNKNWPTTKATTEAVYALLMQGNDWISVKDKTVIKLGDEKIVTKKLSENEKEAGTGYIKMNWKSDEITKEMATVSINNKSEVPGFGGFYWQYFEELDKIKSSQEGPMTIEKELYLKATTSEGNQLQRITSEKSLKIGDLVTVRLVISTKEDMEFVHLKDMRASCFEPIDVLSKYKWQDGLGYYQSTKDVATHFFFDKINKGKFVLEYDIRVNNLGDFSNGITTIQSMYAPEFSSYTKGIRVKIGE